MTAASHDIDDLLRRALHAAVDHVEPAADGLERIRSRARAPRHARAAAALPGTGWPARAGWAVRRGLGPAGDRLAAAVAAVASRFRPAPGAGRLRWSRPAAAFATAIFVVAAGSWAATALPNVISPAASSSSTGGSHGHPGHHHHHGQAGGPSFVPSGSGGPTASPSHGAQPSCGPSPHASRTPHGGHSSTPPPSPSPTPSPTSPSPSPSPSPSSSTTSPSPSPTASTPPAQPPTAGSSTAAAALVAGGEYAAFTARPGPAASSPARSRCGR